MKKKSAGAKPITEQEAHLLERLRKHPERMDRVQSIMELADNTKGPLKTADEIEELLIREFRQLGNVTMNQWATQAEERVSTQFKNQDSTVLSRKKKCFRVGVSLGW